MSDNIREKAEEKLQSWFPSGKNEQNPETLPERQH